MPYTTGNVPFVRGSDTSEDAALSYEHIRKQDVTRIYNCIFASLDGVTCDEVESLLDMRHQTASARIRDLFLAGRIYDTGLRRKTRSGRAARVYMALNEKEQE